MPCRVIAHRIFRFILYQRIHVLQTAVVEGSLKLHSSQPRQELNKFSERAVVRFINVQCNAIRRMGSLPMKRFGNCFVVTHLPSKLNCT